MCPPNFTLAAVTQLVGFIKPTNFHDNSIGMPSVTAANVKLGGHIVRDLQEISQFFGKLSQLWDKGSNSICLRIRKLSQLWDKGSNSMCLRIRKLRQLLDKEGNR